MGGAGRWRAAGLAALLLGGAWAAPVEAQRGASRPPPPVVPRLDLGAVEAGPFPSDRWTVPDGLQRTGLRVALPMPDCRTQASDCDEVRLLNELDGFDLRPRIAIPLSGPVDLASVNPRTLFLVRLGAGPPEALGFEGVTQDPATHTLHLVPERLLEPETRYGLVLTQDVRDSRGRRLQAAPALARLMATRAGPAGANGYAREFRELTEALGRRGLSPGAMAVAAVFTTGSVTTFLEQARDSLDRRPPAAAVMTAPEEGGRAWFPRARLARLTWHPQVATPASGDVEGRPLPLGALAGDAVAGLGIGWYRSPSYLFAGPRIVEPPTGRPLPGPVAEVPVAFLVILPAGPRPAAGWPVAIVGHGYGGEMFTTAMLLAGTLARHGVATVAINVVGHGGGPEGRLQVGLADGSRQTVRVPGRGVDLDGDGRIGPTEGLQPLAGDPLAALGLRDSLRQQAVDLMALHRAVAAGLDADGDGIIDTSRDAFSYVGHSLGGIYGTLFLALEPRLHAGALSVPGGPIPDVARRSPAFRPRLGEALARRSPALLAPHGDLDAVLPAVPASPVAAGGPAAAAGPAGAAIEAFLARSEWLGRRGDPVAYARHLLQAVLPGADPPPVLFQWATGDQVVPNPTTRALLLAGALGDRAVGYRHDRLASRLPAERGEPHGFLLWAAAPGLAGTVGRAAQEQVALFFRSDGAEIPLPALSLPGLDGPLFERGLPPPDP